MPTDGHVRTWGRGGSKISKKLRTSFVNGPFGLFVRIFNSLSHLIFWHNFDFFFQF